MSYYPQNFVAIDFETAYPQRSTVCSVGAVKFIDNKPVEEFYELIQPHWNSVTETSQNLSNLKIHGIYDRDLLDKPYWNEVLPRLEQFVGNLKLVSHNAPFEKSCFNKCNEVYNCSTSINLDIIDTIKVQKEVEKFLGLKISGSGARRLLTLCKMYDINPGQHHNALDDSYMCGYLLVKFNEIFAMSPQELANLNIRVPEPIIESLPTPGALNLDEIL